MEEVFGNATISIDVDNVTENGLENFDALKSAVLEDVSVYKGLVIEEDNIEQASKWRAELNKKAKRISDFRISFEKDFKKKIEKSVQQLKELTSIYSDASNNIDNQLKMFDERRLEEKKQEIEGIYKEVFADWSDTIDLKLLESFSDGKWMNKGTSLDSIKKFMEDTKKKIENGMNSIKGLNSKYEKEMCFAFLRRLDIADALSKKTELERFEAQQIAREEARKKAQEELLAKQKEQEEKATEQDKEQASSQVDETPNEKAIEQKVEEPTYRLQFAVYGTKSQLRSVAEYIKNTGLKYERI